MATSSYDSAFSIGSTRITVGLETSIFMQPQPGQISTVLKFSSGGTCEILAPGTTTLGGGLGSVLYTTLSAAGLSAVSGLGYALSAAEVLTIPGPATYYLNARAATCILHALFYKNQGN